MPKWSKTGSSYPSRCSGDAEETHNRFAQIQRRAFYEYCQGAQKVQTVQFLLWTSETFEFDVFPINQATLQHTNTNSVIKTYLAIHF